MPRAYGQMVALVVGLALVGSAAAATTPTSPVYDSQGHVIGVPFVPPPPRPALTEERALELALVYPKLRGWVARYPADGLTKTATYDEKKSAWTVKVWSEPPHAGQIAL